MTTDIIKNGNSSHFNKRPNRPKKNNIHNGDNSRIFGAEILKNSFDSIPKLVEKYKGTEVSLELPKGFALRITDLDGTIYWGRKWMLDLWSELYLPKPEEMVVIGAIDNFPSLAEGLQLIVLVDRQHRVYFYENEELHLVHKNVEEFFRRGPKFLPIETYHYGQYTAPETEEEYLQILEQTGTPKIDDDTKEFVQSKNKDLTELLDFLNDL
ncbi:hypothetical protein Z043-119034 [Arapaima gigas]